jgi:hypothetical protein
MPPIWQPQPQSTYRYWVETILMESSDKLSDWERNFIDNIDTRLNFGNLSEAQANKLEELYTKYTS